MFCAILTPLFLAFTVYYHDDLELPVFEIIFYGANATVERLDRLDLLLGLVSLVDQVRSRPK